MANPPRPATLLPITLLTLGYEGLAPPDYFKIMQQSGGTHLIDIRRRPQSRKPGYSKRRLAESAAERGLAYTHLVDLGTPRDILYAFREDKNAAKFHRAYSDYLDTVPEALAELAEMVKEQTCCLLCYEAAVAHCHRREVAERVLELQGGEDRCRVVHLTCGTKNQYYPACPYKIGDQSERNDKTPCLNKLWHTDNVQQDNLQRDDC